MSRLEPPTVLVLGGTTEGRELAAALDGRTDVRGLTSLAGRLSSPGALAGDVRTGGFGGPDELAAWLADGRIAAVVDATHPFAAGISANAARACAAAEVPLVVLRRPGWTPETGDRWHGAADLAEAAALVPRLGRRVLLATGRQEVAVFAGVSEAWFLVRAIERPDGPLPPHHQVLLARGPYVLADERRLLQDHDIDLVVTKDAGGDATRAKLDAARELAVPVLLVRRPPPPPDAPPAVPTVAEALVAVDRALAGRRSPGR